MMDVFLRIIRLLQYEINRPKCYGAFHICWLIFGVAAVYILLRADSFSHEKTLKTALGIYGFTALILELAKQIIWSYDGNWHYQWYAAPFQLCTTPIYASIAAFFFPKGKIRDSLLSYMAFVTILGSLATAVYPESCFVRTLLVNIHTMFLHIGSLALSLYLLARVVEFTRNEFQSSCTVFMLFAAVAEALNVIVYRSGILKGQSFNMFYISPYFISALPVFSQIQQKLPFVIFLAVYILMIMTGARLVFVIAKQLRERKSA